MGSFGQRLQREREMRGITLEEIATSTKIGTRSLRALEEEDFDQLPAASSTRVSCAPTRSTWASTRSRRSPII